jgi:sulfur dioxygenase
MLFRQLFDSLSSTYSYLLADEATGEAVIIDPVVEQVERDTALIHELGLTLLYSMETHVHADHVTAAAELRRRFRCKTVLSERAGAPCADVLVKEGDEIRFGRYGLEVRETPGHTEGCVTYVAQSEYLAFTGDALLIRGCGRTDFQQGSSRELYRSVHEKIFTLAPATLIYPAHDYKGRTCTSVAEEMELNPRLACGKTLEEFESIMQDLKLDRPKKIDVAVPANLRCGEVTDAGDDDAHFAWDWAPLENSAAHVPEVSPEWVHDHLGETRVVDVRELDEYREDLGHIEGAELVPLAALGIAAAHFDQDRPIVTVCRSGGRSAKAALLLARRGFSRVASLAGGMRRWHERGFGVEFGPPKGAPGRQG